MRTWIDIVNLWLVSIQATYVICGAILAVAMVWAIYARVRFRKARRAVNEAAQQVQSLGSERGSVLMLVEK